MIGRVIMSEIPPQIYSAERLSPYLDLTALQAILGRESDSLCLIDRCHRALKARNVGDSEPREKAAHR